MPKASLHVQGFLIPESYLLIGFFSHNPLHRFAKVCYSVQQWLSNSTVSKLIVNADPGSILTGAQREFCRSWPNQEEVTAKGIHFVQEDSPTEIGEAIAGFLGRLSW